jgi:hypothetical protein
VAGLALRLPIRPGANVTIAPYGFRGIAFTLFSARLSFVQRRLEDRIRDLCAKLIVAGDGKPEFESLAHELREALRKYTERIRAKLRDYPIANERRDTGT